MVKSGLILKKMDGSKAVIVDWLEKQIIYLIIVL